MKTSTAGPLLLFAVAATGVARLQPPLAKAAHEVKQRDDVYALPPPAQLRVATLGWQAAAVDLLWSKLLVEYGIHFAEHREFYDIPNYVDAILELEPDYAPVYRYVSTMLAYRPLHGTDADVRRARAYLERGTRERPDDARLWLEYGQFIAFVAPSFLQDAKEADAWRTTGAEAIGHAVELGEDADRALSAATMLTRAGATDQAIRFLEHAYEMTEHPSMIEVHEQIGRKLATLQRSAIRDAADAAARRVNERWEREMPFLSRDLYVLVGPATEPLRCVGVAAPGDPSCARDWGAAVEGDTR